MARGLCGISAAATPACRRERSPFQRCRHGGAAACRRGGHRPGLKLRRPSNFSCSWFGRGAPFFLWLPRSVRGTCRFSWSEPRSGWPRPGGRDPAGYEPAVARGHSGGGTRAQWKGASGARCRLHMGTRWPIGRPAVRWWPHGAREEEAARRGSGARRPGERLLFRQRRRCPATATRAASARTVCLWVMGAEAPPLLRLPVRAAAPRRPPSSSRRLSGKQIATPPSRKGAARPPPHLDLLQRLHLGRLLCSHHGASTSSSPPLQQLQLAKNIPFSLISIRVDFAEQGSEEQGNKDMDALSAVMDKVKSHPEVVEKRHRSKDKEPEAEEKVEEGEAAQNADVAASADKTEESNVEQAVEEIQAVVAVVQQEQTAPTTETPTKTAATAETSAEGEKPEETNREVEKDDPKKRLDFLGFFTMLFERFCSPATRRKIKWYAGQVWISRCVILDLSCLH
ncbi:hypothetical protein SETIT_3G388600v2 [Setaria italica]|uniref:Uncharacterized protein n=1 Tax=Setaria italica TaxID=4555 RepID=A0A368QNT6_SETIT|nr:hypothetical protein SETIT_3G388600v2 [Setaria italica]